MPGSAIQITYIGGPTALIEIGGLRLLTDPVFDPPGGKYSFGLGTGSEKLDAPAIAPDELGRIDAVLLSPPLSHPLVGDVIGFVLEWEGQRDGAFWISGDTVYYRGVTEVGERFDVGTGLIHLGGVRFPISGPARYTMNAKEAARVASEFGLETLLPIHYEGWKHFREGRVDAEQEFAPAGVADRVRWLNAGVAESVEV